MKSQFEANKTRLEKDLADARKENAELQQKVSVFNFLLNSDNSILVNNVNAHTSQIFAHRWKSFLNTLINILVCCLFVAI